MKCIYEWIIFFRFYTYSIFITTHNARLITNKLKFQDSLSLSVYYIRVICYVCNLHEIYLLNEIGTVEFNSEG